MEFMSLKILDNFKGLFGRLGIDYEMMRIILNTKLLLDSRKAPVISGQNKKNETENPSFIKRYLLHLIFGLFLAFFIYFINDEMIRMIYFSGAMFFMTTMYLISDFSFVLLDTKDKNILMTKPVDSKAVSLAKVLHILIYMFRLNIFLAGPSLVAIVMLNGVLAIPVLLLEILFMDLLIFLVTAFIYILVLRFFDGEFLRNIINYIQILLTILVTVGYQIAIRMIDFSDLQNITYTFKVYNYLNPILWFGAPFEILFNGGDEMYLYIFVLLLIVVPVSCFIVYIKLSKKMESLLLKLESDGGEKPLRHPIESLVGRVLNRNEVTRQSFHFANSVIRSDRSLKLKIYPALSTGILLPVLMIFNMGVRGKGYEPLGFEYLYLYFNLLIIPSVINLVLFSSAWKGAYIYAVTGFTDTKKMFRGILEAVVIRLFIPLMIVNSAIYIVLFKDRFAVDIVSMLIATIAIFPVLGRIYLTEFPFSRPIDESNQGKDMDKFIYSLGVIVCIVIMHVVFRRFQMGVWIYIGLMAVLLPLSWIFVSPKVTKPVNEAKKI
ncbi:MULTISPECIES: hypothetical protein [unclassified Sedimentibacter]|uniref:hypothetical protein n=1 Tax=unclassified Sedimentibacter TaxID=2649220 RepID=UPI0027E03A83|nr:hypothetical protein [Sedimentibacter sp. MB35-C1]WMJ78911.1 hypothetical protein RBQ61_08265 [Sedimentibacter sp. MB35-C1]